MNSVLCKRPLGNSAKRGLRNLGGSGNHPSSAWSGTLPSGLCSSSGYWETLLCHLSGNSLGFDQAGLMWGQGGGGPGSCWAHFRVEPGQRGVSSGSVRLSLGSDSGQSGCTLERCEVDLGAAWSRCGVAFGVVLGQLEVTSASTPGQFGFASTSGSPAAQARRPARALGARALGAESPPLKRPRAAAESQRPPALRAGAGRLCWSVARALPPPPPPPDGHALSARGGSRRPARRPEAATR